MKHKLVYIILFFIIIVAAFLRIYQLGDVPPSPDWDEAALAYNSYSILETGRDEYGEFLPIILRSFDDYKPALYAYLIIPFIKLFGLSLVAVRLPSVILGVLTVLATYFLVKELFRNTSTSFWQARNERVQNLSKRWRFWSRPDYIGGPQNDERIALLSAGLLAISPWHIQFSRVAFESNVGVAFNVFGALFFLLGLRKKPWLLSFSTLFMAIGLYVYQGEKVFVPLIFTALAIIFRRSLISIQKRYVIMAILIGFIASLPILHYTVTNRDALSRAKGVSAFADLTPLLKDNVKRLVEDRENNNYIGLLLDNRRVVYTKSVIEGYLSHFDLNWLFITGDIARHHAPNMGLLYLWELPFLLIGIYGLVFGNFDKKLKYFIFAWILVTPIPASITSGVPHAVRVLNFLPILQILTAIGVIFALQKISNIKYRISKIQVRYLIFTMYSLFFVFNFLYYLNQYFVQQNYFTAYDWQYGYEKAIPEILKIEGNFDRIVVSNEPPMDQSYIFFLFYLKYPPLLYYKEAENVSGGFKEDHRFGKYEFRPIDWVNEERSFRTLFVGRQSDFPDSVNIVNTILYPNGKPAIQLASYK